MRPYHVRAALALIPALLLVALLATAEDKKPPALPAKDWSKATAFKVTRAIDGDTIEVEQDGKPVKVRLIGVDTPETVHPSKPVEAFGKEAAKFTANLLKGESVYLGFDKDKQDKYGRTLAYVYRARRAVREPGDRPAGVRARVHQVPIRPRDDEAVPPLRGAGA